MSQSPDRPSSRHLVAPELLAGIDMFPAMDVSDELIRQIRTAPQSVARITSDAPLPPELAAVRCTEHRIPGPDGAPEVRILHYEPAAPSLDTRPAILDIHGGGYVMGMPEASDRSHRAAVHALGCVLVSVAYRLAPETRWPGAVEDCYAALRWMHENAGLLGIDRDRIAVTGSSAGGGHAASLTMLARDRGDYAICFQYLHAPMLDDRTGITRPAPANSGEFIWTPTSNRYGWGALLGMEPGGDDVPQGAVPARASDLSGLPPALIIVGALDLFVGEDIDYARRLLDAGVPTELYVIPGAYHGFGLAGDTAPQVIQTTRLSREALARALAPKTP
ncbi:MAG TPA: alpha/beta hydrolase [Sphingobium sp.]